MTLVITTVSPETVVQVSDTRLTSLKDQSKLSESLRKSLIVTGTEAQFAIGWCGLATADEGHSTGDWLFRVLYEMNAVKLPPDEVIGNLADLATARFQTLTARDKRCQFVLGGWDQTGPFVGLVSNYHVLNPQEQADTSRKHHIPSFTEAREPTNKFQGWIERFRNLTEHHYLVGVIGDCNAAKLNTHFRGLEGLLKKRAAATEISNACRQIVLEAGSRSKTIGSDLIALEMERNGHTYCAYYSESGAEVMLAPDMLGLQGGSTEMTVRPILAEGQVKIRLQGKIIRYPQATTLTAAENDPKIVSEKR
jgi:hypothetical protein